MFNYKEDNSWTNVGNSKLSKIEVNKSGFFREKIADNKYVDINLIFDKRRQAFYLKKANPFINFSAAKLVYETFNNLKLSNSNTIGYKDNNCRNLALHNLIIIPRAYRKKINELPSITEINKWLEVIEKNDTVKSLSKKINLCPRVIFDRLKKIRVKLNIEARRIKLIDLLQQYTAMEKEFHTSNTATIGDGNGNVKEGGEGYGIEGGY